jgi:hypothetical protein
MATITLTSQFVLVPFKWIMVTKSGIILIDAMTHEKAGSWSAVAVRSH